MRFSVVALAGMALLLVAAAPIVATDGAVTIGFAPPPGTPISYRCTAVRTIGGREQTLATVNELVFAGTTDADRTLRWTVKSLAVTGDEPIRTMLQKTGDIAVGQPVEIALANDDRDATITNLAALRTHVDAAVPVVKPALSPLFAPAPAATREALAAMLDNELGSIDADTPEAFTAAWLDGIEPLVGGEAPLIPGHVVEDEVDAAAPIGDGALRYKLRYGLRDYVPGKSAVVFHTLTSDPADVQRYARAFVDKLFPDAGAPGQNEATATLAILSQMSSTTELASEISLPTGLRTHFTSATTTVIPGRPKKLESRDCTLVTDKVL